jgi:uncharacterized protein YbbC (DUF1343 family)
MPSLKAATLYPGTGIFEASDLSVGRGTRTPFEWIGAPWIDSAELLKTAGAQPVPGVILTMQDETPSKSTYKGRLCRGLRITVIDREKLDPIALFLVLNHALMALYPNDFQWRWPEAEKMVGTSKFQQLCERGAKPDEILKLFQKQDLEFTAARKPFLLYR